MLMVVLNAMFNFLKGVVSHNRDVIGDMVVSFFTNITVSYVGTFLNKETNVWLMILGNIHMNNSCFCKICSVKPLNPVTVTIFDIESLFTNVPLK